MFKTVDNNTFGLFCLLVIVIGCLIAKIDGAKEIAIGVTGIIGGFLAGKKSQADSAADSKNLQTP